MNITQAKFIKGVIQGDAFWDPAIPQIVFYGRSNVGKSSTLNALLDRNSLAKSSGTPGKTKEINFFKINDAFYFIDLPGYGYAHLGKQARAQLQELIFWFMLETQAERRMNVFILDAKVGLTDLDREMLEALHNRDEGMLILLNKCDKLNQSDLAKVTTQVREQIPSHVPVIPFSAIKKKNVHKVWEILEK